MGKLETEVVVNNINGLHVRPSTAIAQASQPFKCNVSLKKGDVVVNAKSSLDIISAFIVYKDKLILECDGEDADSALVKVKEAVEAIYDYNDAHPVN